MWTETTAGRQLIEEISKELVIQFAPEELDLFDELMYEYFQNPTPPEVSLKSKDDPLGFGLSELLVSVSPAAAAMVGAALNYLMNEVLKSTKDESADFVKKKIKLLFHSEEDNPSSVNQGGQDIPGLTKDQLEQIRKLAIKQAVAFKIAPDKAKRMADALIGSLSIS